MESLFFGFLNRSLTAAILILAVCLVRLVFKKAPRWLICALWALVAVRLVCPFSVESVLSLIPSAEPVQPEIVYSAQPAITSGVPLIDEAVNPPLAAAFTPSPAQSANPLQIAAFLAACIWLAGAAILLVYAAVSAIRLRLRVRMAVRLEGNVWQSEFVSSPFILGVFRPRIYLPYNMDAQQQTMVLAHERAHLKRGDQLWKPLGFLLLAAYWFNPLCWLAYVLLCRDIEAACDEKVVRALGTDCKKAYSEALLACSVPRRLIAACPLAFGETNVKTRIKAVLNYKKPAFWLVLAAVLASVIVAVCFLTDPKQAPEEPAASLDEPAEADPVTPIGYDSTFGSVQDYAEFQAQLRMEEPVQYMVQTNGGFETVTDTVRDAQAVNLEQLAELPGLDPEGTLQLWSFSILVSPENEAGRTILLSSEGLGADGRFVSKSMIDGSEYYSEGGRHLVTVVFRDKTQDYQLLGWTKDPDGTALDVYEQSGSLKDYLRDVYAASHGGQTYYNMAFYTGLDGYGRQTTVDAYYLQFSEGEGRYWGAYIPTTGWLRNLGSRMWYSEYQTGSTFEVTYFDEPVTDRSDFYEQQGYKGEAGARCQLLTLEAGESNTLVYLYGAQEGCYEVRIHWQMPADGETAYGYDARMQSRCEGQILKQMAQSFTVVNPDGSQADSVVTLLTHADYTVFTRTERLPLCPNGDSACLAQHTQTTLVYRAASGEERIIDGPAADTSYWVDHTQDDYLLFGSLTEDPDADENRFTVQNLVFDLKTFEIRRNVFLENASLGSVRPVSRPDTVAVDETMPLQPCELILPNGLFFGADYETVLTKATAAADDQAWKGRARGLDFSVADVEYHFLPNEDNVLQLYTVYYHAKDFASDTFLRGVHIGDSLQSVLAKFPVKTAWTPGASYLQYLYGDYTSSDRVSISTVDGGTRLDMRVEDRYLVSFRFDADDKLYAVSLADLSLEDLDPVTGK